MRRAVAAGALFIPVLLSCASVRADEDAESEQGHVKLLGHRFSIGVGAGVGALTSARSRAAFGGTHWQPAVRLVGRRGSRGLHFTVSPVFDHYKKDDRESRVMAPTLGVAFNLARPSRFLVPFGALTTGPYFVWTTGGPTRIVAGGNAELGLSVARRFIVSGGYSRIGGANGFDLSSWSANAIVKVY